MSEVFRSEFEKYLLEESDVKLMKEIVLGVGGFGTVYAGSVSLNQGASPRTCAIKQILISGLDETQVRTAAREIRALINVSEKCRDVTVEFFGLVMPKFASAGEGNFELWIVMEKMDLSLRRVFQKHDERLMSTDQKIVLGVKLVRSVAKLHDNSTLHLDFKPENILLDSSLTKVRLSDFGLSHVSRSVRNTKSSKVSIGGITPLYSAPEHILLEVLSEMKIGRETDVFALALVLLELFCGTVPFADTVLATRFGLFFSASVDGRQIAPVDMIAKLPPSLRLPITYAMSVYPKGRCTASYLYHAFIACAREMNVLLPLDCLYDTTDPVEYITVSPIDISAPASTATEQPPAPSSQEKKVVSKNAETQVTAPVPAAQQPTASNDLVAPPPVSSPPPPFVPSPPTRSRSKSPDLGRKLLQGKDRIVKNAVDKATPVITATLNRFKKLF